MFQVQHRETSYVSQVTKLDSQRHMEETMRRGYEGRYVSRSRLTRGHFLNSPQNSKTRKRRKR